MTTTANFNIDNSLDALIKQVFAESYWTDYFNVLNNPASRESDIKRAFTNTLRRGNNTSLIVSIEHPISSFRALGNATKLTQTLAEEAFNKYDVVSSHENDMTGFSATLIKEKATNKYTLSFRSTEVIYDGLRDANGADLDIKNTGYALAQLAAMESYYDDLKSEGIIPNGAVLDVTGYSLGGHLASAFYLMHPLEVNHLYTANNPGVGNIMDGLIYSGQTHYINEMVGKVIPYFKDFLVNFFQITNKLINY